MLNYYIAKKEHLFPHVESMSGISKWDFIEHGDEILLCASFGDTQIQDAFEAQSGVVRFPHMLEMRPVGKEIAERLKEFGVAESDTTMGQR